MTLTPHHGMRGYWTDSKGRLSVTFAVPSRLERFLRWFDGEFWTPYQ